MSNVQDMTPRLKYIQWGEGIAIKRAGTIVAIIPRDDLPLIMVASAKALKG